MGALLIIPLILGLTAGQASAQRLDADRLSRSLDLLVDALHASDMAVLEPALAHDFRIGEFSGGMARSIIRQVVASGRLQPESVRVDSVHRDGEHHRVYATFRTPSGDRTHDLVVTDEGYLVEINVMRVKATSQTQAVSAEGERLVDRVPVEQRRPEGTNAALRARLLRLLEGDQNYRRSLAALNGRPDPTEGRRLMALQRGADSVNVAELIDILETHRWPRAALVGAEAGLAAFLVLQHAPPDVQRQYLPMAREAVRSGDLAPSHLALLEDRVLMHQDRPQTYGTQLVKDAATGELQVWPIEDEENVDARRASVGLPPLSDYLRGFGLDRRAPR